MEERWSVGKTRTSRRSEMTMKTFVDCGRAIHSTRVVHDILVLVDAIRIHCIAGSRDSHAPLE